MVRVDQGRDCSSWEVRRSRVASSPKRPRKWTPTGSPAGFHHSGTDIAGAPVMLATTAGKPMKPRARSDARSGSAGVALLEELSRAVGLGGRARRLGDDTERARKAVSARIRDAIARINRAHPALGRHLDQAVATGTRCAYAPAEPVRWRL
jgi:hypothetical protein